jgi:hypothetical protein
LRKNRRVAAGANDDALVGLASSLNRPPASLAAFRGLSDEQLRLLARAVNATCERRQQEIDVELTRALPSLPRSLLLPLLRGAGIGPLRRALVGRLR